MVLLKCNPHSVTLVNAYVWLSLIFKYVLHLILEVQLIYRQHDRQMPCYIGNISIRAIPPAQGAAERGEPSSPHLPGR